MQEQQIDFEKLEQFYHFGVENLKEQTYNTLEYMTKIMNMEQQKQRTVPHTGQSTPQNEGDNNGNTEN